MLAASWLTLDQTRPSYYLLCQTGEGAPGNYVASGYSVYEEENEHLQEGLRAKVSALKHVSSPLDYVTLITELPTPHVTLFIDEC